MRCGQWIEDVHLGTGEERRNDFEGWIFGRRADERDVASFDVGKKSVLLGFVYPELLFAVAAVQVLLGRYTGYRLLELLRFRKFWRS